MQALEKPSRSDHRHKRLFPDRAFLTMDFLPSENLIKSNVGKLGPLPIPSQESAIIEDLLFCLMGN